LFIPALSGHAAFSTATDTRPAHTEPTPWSSSARTDTSGWSPTRRRREQLPSTFAPC